MRSLCLALFLSHFLFSSCLEAKSTKAETTEPEPTQEIFSLILQLAVFGDADAQFEIGNMYYTGENLPQDYGTAVDWYRLAAKQGHPYAQNNLGAMYQTGEGVQQDYGDSVKWYRLAAEQGYAAAQANLGMMYAKGEGVPQDYKEAYAWLNIAAAKGLENAAKNRNIVANKLDQNSLSDAQKLSHKYYEEFK